MLGSHIFSVNNKVTKKCIFCCPETICKFRSNFLMLTTEGKKKKARTLRRDNRWLCYLLLNSLMQTHSINFYWGPLPPSRKLYAISRPARVCTLSFQPRWTATAVPIFPCLPTCQTLQSGEQQETWGFLLGVHIWKCSAVEGKRA